MDTIVSLIDNSCRKFGARPALLTKHQEAWQETTYDQLRSASASVAGGLRARRFLPGDHLALMAPSSPQWVMAYLGILKAGGVVVPIDKELKSLELEHILSHSQAQAFFCSEEHLPRVLAMRERLRDLRLIVTIDSAANGLAQPAAGPSYGGCTVLPLSALTGEGTAIPGPRSPDDTALILYTSGTTGRAKGAMLSHANIVANIRGAISHLQVDETIHTLSFLPIAHVFEQVCGILLPLSLGGKVSFCESLKKLGDNLAEVQPTFFVGVPAFYRLIYERITRKIAVKAMTRWLFALPPTRPLVAAGIRKKLGAGTIFVSGGAALDPAISKGLARLGITIFQGYGITETSPVIAVESATGARPGTVGRALPGVEVRIDRPDVDGVGEILVRGANVMQGYYKDPQATAEVLVDGWYRTGDLGSLDRDGFLTIRGRIKNLIVSPNGRNVYPEEVENEILKSPFIAEAMVYAHRAGETVEEIRAVVHPAGEALEDYAREQGREVLSAPEVAALIRQEVATACKRLADYKRVRKVTIRETEFPKTTTRKIKRFEVPEE